MSLLSASVTVIVSVYFLRGKIYYIESTQLLIIVTVVDDWNIYLNENIIYKNFLVFSRCIYTKRRNLTGLKQLM